MDTAIVAFRDMNRDIQAELEIPLWITANDLIYALNIAYDLQIDPSDSKEYYLGSENPIAFLRGNRELGEYGIRNGTLIFYKRRPAATGEE